MGVGLNPCPICGALPKLQTLEPEYHSNKYFCSTSCFHISCGDWKSTKEAAADDWNRRTEDKKQPDYWPKRELSPSQEEMASKVKRVIRALGKWSGEE